MNRTERERPSSLWHNGVPHTDPMVAGGDDIGKYLDIDFSNFEGLNDGQPSGLDTPMDRLAFEHFEMPMMSGNSHENMQMEIHMSQNGMMHMNQHQPNPYIMQNYQIPPTPVSSEMAAKYTQQFDNQGHMVYDRYPNSFTPLVSPAQTPLDSNFSIPDYSNNTDVFSPLTSPAIEAQRHQSSTGTTASPVDLNAGSPVPKFPPNAMARRNRRRPSTSKGPPARSIKQSPAMKPQTRRRPTSLATLPSETIGGIVSEHKAREAIKPGSASGKILGSSDSSVSPEPLSESLMPPPAVPGPSTRSPVLIAKSQHATANEPATPATLMRIPNNSKPGSAPSSTQSRIEGDEVMEDIMLPESAANSRPVLTPIDTARGEHDEQTTPMVPMKSAKLNASSTPRTAAMTPQILSPTGHGVSKPVRSESKSGVRGKKRQGMASAAVSPALRPKISPSITPLMPATGAQFPPLTAESTALYLASKSNYQNILEGTHLPGVTYPETLAENLSSKRTSHKIAEQGRRNRINTALKEIEALLPSSILANGKKERSISTDDGEGEKMSSSGQGASKASTVEMAIVYIKNLQAELKATKEKLNAAEQRLAHDRSSGSQSSD